MRIFETPSDGWELAPAARAVALLTIGPAIAAGFVLTISLFFMMFGGPLLATAYCALHGVSRHRNRMLHPALSVASLASVELFLAGLFVALVGMHAWSVVFFAPGLVTLAAALLMTRMIRPGLTPPPPAPVGAY